jgi:AraC-like DNA-binding protein
MLSAVRLVRRFSSAYWHWIREDGDRVWFCERFVGGADDGSDQVDAYAIAALINGVRDVVGPDWRPEHMRVPARARAAIRGIDAWSDARIESTRDVSAVAIPRRLLTIALPAAREQRIENKDAGSKISAPPSDFISSVALVIKDTAADRPTSLKRVGEAVGTSARSLQRQLADLGLTFSELLARIRLSHARELLRDPAVKIIDVAFELGYSDPANFTRAFSRWTGVPPREYRRSLLGN